MNEELLNQDISDYLSHAGVPGMSWYKHKYGKWQKQAQYAGGMDDPNAHKGNGQDHKKDKSHYKNTFDKALKQLTNGNTVEKLLQKQTVKNIEKWGTDKDHNVLYITGHSGSGKSTIAQEIADEKTDKIHLDLYMEEVSKDSFDAESNSAFNAYLKKNFSNYEKMLKGLHDHSSDERKVLGRYLEEFENIIDEFGSKQFSKGRKVIVEGVQLSDETLHPDKKYFKDKPTIVMNTGSIKSFYRAGRRDQKLLDLLNPIDMKEYYRWYKNNSNNLKAMKNELTHCSAYF